MNLISDCENQIKFGQLMECRLMLEDSSTYYPYIKSHSSLVESGSNMILRVHENIIVPTLTISGMDNRYEICQYGLNPVISNECTGSPSLNRSTVELLSSVPKMEHEKEDEELIKQELLSNVKVVKETEFDKTLIHNCGRYELDILCLKDGHKVKLSEIFSEPVLHQHFWIYCKHEDGNVVNAALVIKVVKSEIVKIVICVNDKRIEEKRFNLSSLTYSKLKNKLNQWFKVRGKKVVKDVHGTKKLQKERIKKGKENKSEVEEIN